MILKSINKIELTFENLESVIIPLEYIKLMTIDNVYNKMYKFHSNDILLQKCCKSLALAIHHEANKKENLLSWGFEENDTLPFQRICQGNDITSIYMHGKKKQNNPIYVPWGDSAYTNDYQQTYVNKFNDIFIVIGEEIFINDYFKVEYLEDKDYIDYIG